MSRLRAAIVMGVHWSTQMGGAEMQAEQVGVLLARRGDEATYLALRGAENAFRHGLGESWPIEVRMLDAHDPVEERAALIESLRAIRPHVCYSRDFASMSTTLSACRDLGIRLVAHVSSDNVCRRIPQFTDWRKRKPSAYVRFWRCQRALLSADCIVCQTRSQLADMTGLTHRAQNTLTVLPSIVRMPVQDQGSRHLQRGTFTAVWIGGLKSVKRPEAFVSVARRLRHAGMRFVMVGADVSGAYGSLVSRARLEGLVEYVGPRSPMEVQQHLASADVLVNTSRHEGFPATYLEAFSHGMPVVSLGVDPDGIISRHGLGHVAHSIPDLCAALYRLAVDAPTCRAMGMAAEKYVVRHHSSEVVASRYYRVFDDVALIGDSCGSHIRGVC